MRTIIGLIVFWISTFGYLIYTKKKTKLPYEIALPIIFSLIGILMFIGGILNMMIEFTIVILLLGLILFAYSFIKKEIKIKELFNENFIIIALLFLYITIVFSRMNLLHYDNFSHWGLIVKNMFIYNRLPNFENAVIEFKNYQPGSACFIYYIGLIFGKTEGSMIIGQNYLLLSYFISLFALIKQKEKNNILKILLLVLYIFMLFANKGFKPHDLLVDTLIANMTICSFVILTYFKNDMKKGIIFNLPILIFLFLVKNTGIILVGFSCLYILYLGIVNKEWKKGLIYAILSGLITVVFFYIWSKHVSYVYGSAALASKHSLSADNFGSQLSSKGLSGIIEIIKIYVKHFLQISNNLPHKYMIGINVIVISLVGFFKKNKKEFLYCLAAINIVYLLYYGILGVMYLVSMPLGEARILAGFDRYMMTIICVVVGIVAIFYIRYIEKENKIVYYIISTILIFIMSFVTVKYNIGDYKILFGDMKYNNTTAYKLDKILKSNNYSAKLDEYYYIYAPSTSKNDFGYMNYLSKYKLNTKNVTIVKELHQLYNQSTEYKNKIIIIDEEEKIYDYIKNNNYIKHDNMYINAH